MPPALVLPDTYVQASNMRREYVAGGGLAWYANILRSLPPSIDDVTADFGSDLYERMMVDPQVAATVAIFKASILESGLTVNPAVQKESDEGYDLAVEIHAECERWMENLDTPLPDVLWNMLDSVPYGNKVAEQVYDTMASLKDGKGIQSPVRLKVKPRHTTAFVVDAYDNLVGLLARIPGELPIISLGGTLQFTPDQARNLQILPKGKFMISQFRPVDADPRGTSILRAAYDPWWRKRQMVPEYLKYLAQFATPSVIGYTPPGAEPITQIDSTGATVLVTAEEIMANALEALRGGTVAVFKDGAKVDPLQMQGDGSPFLSGFGEANQEITKAILTQELATEEGRHMARAAAQVHQDVLDTLIRQAKASVLTMFRQQVLLQWVRTNWGEKALRYTPRPSLGMVQLRSMGALLQGVAALVAAGYFSPSQFAGMDELLGLPYRVEDGPPLKAQGSGSAGSAASDGTGSPSPQDEPAPSDNTNRQDGQPAPDKTDDGRVRVREHTRNPRTRPNQNANGEFVDDEELVPA